MRTADNFGTTGETPSHPELLDDLAVRFMEEGWSVKTLVRRIVLSRTYRLSAGDDPRGLADDPENRLLWRANRRRLDAECLRDTMLTVSGRLDPEDGRPELPDRPGRRLWLSAATTPGGASIGPVFRNALPELFEVFDFADPSLVVGRRNVSTVAPQALFDDEPPVRHRPGPVGRPPASGRADHRRRRPGRARLPPDPRPPTQRLRGPHALGFVRREPQGPDAGKKKPTETETEAET